MSEPEIRGIHDHEQRDPKIFLRDSRRLGERAYDFLAVPNNTVFVLVTLTILSWVFPGLVFVTLPVGILCFLVCHWARKTHWSQLMPLRAPISYGRTDYNDPKPGRTGYHMASGILFCGNDVIDNAEIWASKRDLLTHILVLGTTGAGKSENLLSKAANIMAMGGGLVYSDAKGTAMLQWQLYSLARMMGVEDDYLCINYLTGNKSSLSSRGFQRLSNTVSPFSRGSADSNVQILSSLVPQSEGDNAIFSERAIALVSAIMYPLEELRDQEKLALSPDVIREYLNFEKVVELSKRSDISERARDIVLQYLKSLPGYNPDYPPEEQPEEVGRQFGFAQSYFTRALSSLADTYGHIYWTALGEVDFHDVIMNNRILCITLPVMEKSPQEVQNLGKISLAGIKDSLSAGLGGRLEGNRRDVLESLPIQASVPTMFILDEYGYQAVEGFSVTAAQARGLGMSFVFAGQDWAGFKRASEKEAGQIWGNTRIKEFMSLEDIESMEMAAKAVGEAMVTQVSGFERSGSGLVAPGYRDAHNTSIDKRARIDFRDLQSQLEGEMHMVTRGRLIRCRAFYANIPLVSDFRLNRFLKLPYDNRVGVEDLSDLDPFASEYDPAPDDSQRPETAPMRKSARRSSEHFETFREILLDSASKDSKPGAATEAFQTFEDAQESRESGNAEKDAAVEAKAISELSESEIETICSGDPDVVEKTIEAALEYAPPPADDDMEDLVAAALDRLSKEDEAATR